MANTMTKPNILAAAFILPRENTTLAFLQQHTAIGEKIVA
jgi:hypothetical protein